MPALAQEWPSKAIKIIVVYPPGGTSDAVTRLLAEKISPALGQQVLVENRGGGQVITDAAGGQFELFTANPSPGVNAMLRQGKFRILAVAAPRRLAALPAVPTLTELGYPDSNYTSHFGVFAPARTPEAVLKRLHAEINAALALPEVAERLTKLDNVVAPSSAVQFGQVIRREHEANAKIVAQAGIRSE